MTAVRRLLAALGRSLSAAGWMWLGLAGVGPSPPPGSAPPLLPGPLRPPPEGHPERLCPEVPLTEAERALARDLARTAPRDSG
ncbi:DUF6059 family protein [Streptomyces sp. NPDC012600]|uniref:DUF6059 family protein n=1 Tax=Streptomyces sp. NPDC012600 TaxID=3415005 RepID=UPI003C2E568B